MPSKESLALICLLLIFTTVIGCDRPNRIELLRHKRIIKEDRAKKDKAFKFSKNSPVPENMRWKFKKLNYFPIDISYKVKASYTKISSHDELMIQTSSGGPRVYVTMGVFEFKLQGTPLKLKAYQEKSWQTEAGHNALFLPFTDLTTGKSTYGAGRYLDIKKPAEKEAVIDFNLAYNPYCAYNHNYSCPIPPSDNNLNVAIESGEKK